MIRTTTLSNGLRVVTEAMDGVESVGLSFWVGTGSRDETDAQQGMSHFLEHLLFKGSTTRSALEIAQAIDAVGGDMNAFTTKETTSFYVRVLGDDCAESLDILCDIMCDPAFDAREIEAERQVVLEEILMRNDDPGELVHEYFASAMYGAHPLGRDILGSDDHIASMPGEDIQAFFEHHYRPRNMVFAAAGKLDHDDMVAKLESHFGAARTPGESPVRKPPAPQLGTFEVQNRPTDQAHLVMGVPAPDRHDMDRYAVSLLDQILGGGMSSRLFQEVREKRGLAYTVFSSYSGYDDMGEMSMYVGTSPKRVKEALATVREEAQRIGSEGVTQLELDRAKQSLRATTLMNLEDTTARMSRIGRSMLLHGDVLSIDEIQHRINVVTVDDLQRLTKQLFSVEPVIVGLGPIKEKDLAI